MLNYHELKTWPDYYISTAFKVKRFEVRKNDRNFQMGDVLCLREFDPEVNEYTGRKMRVQVGYILKGGQFGIDPNYVVMGITPLE